MRGLGPGTSNRGYVHKARWATKRDEWLVRFKRRLGYNGQPTLTKASAAGKAPGMRALLLTCFLFNACGGPVPEPELDAGVEERALDGYPGRLGGQGAADRCVAECRGRNTAGAIHILLDGTCICAPGPDGGWPDDGNGRLRP